MGLSAGGGVMTGFVRVEDDSERRKRKLPLSATAVSGTTATPAASKSRSKGTSRWLYGVLEAETLRLYARRTDYKRQTPPISELALQMRAVDSNESVFGFDHECIYIRCKETGQVITLRIHQRKEIVRWVTALYYQSLNPSRSPSNETMAVTIPTRTARSKSTKQESTTKEAPPAAARAKSKSVSFIDEPQVCVLPRESYDPADLFYSDMEYEQFLHKEPSLLSNLVKTIYTRTAAKLKVSHKKQLQ